jgi:hypothetical protein
MRLRKVLIPAAILIFLASLNFSCSSSKDDSSKIKNSDKNGSKLSVNTNPYFPVTEGNSWEYTSASPGANPSSFTVTVNKITNDGTDKIVELSSFPFFTNQNDTVMLRIKENGAIYTSGKTSTDDLCFPVTSDMQVGSKWQYGQWSVYIGKANDTVFAPSGTYTDCVLITYSIAFTFVSEIWMAKDVGIVKWGANRINPPTLNPVYYLLNKVESNK